MAEFSKLYDAILNGDEKLALQLTREALNQGVDPSELISKWMIPAMDEVGRLFEAQEYYVPELLLAGRAMKTALEPLRPLLVASGAQPTGRIVLGTVKGDLHDIGKNLVTTFLTVGGYQVIDLGTDVPNEKLIDIIQKEKPDVVGLSALLTTTMLGQRQFMAMLKEKGLRDKVKVMVGGAPVSQAWADEIGADGYGADAVDGKNKIDAMLHK